MIAGIRNALKHKYYDAGFRAALKYRYYNTKDMTYIEA